MTLQQNAGTNMKVDTQLQGEVSVDQVQAGVATMGGAAGALATSTTVAPQLEGGGSSAVGPAVGGAFAFVAVVAAVALAIKRRRAAAARAHTHGVKTTDNPTAVARHANETPETKGEAGEDMQANI